MGRAVNVTPNRLVLVGGHSRGVGKTAAIEHLLRLWRDEAWVAIKISAHRHALEGDGAPLIEEAGDPSPVTQTGRFLVAGAKRAFLCRCPEGGLRDVAVFIESFLADGSNVIVESNRIVRCLSPDLTMFVVSDQTEDWKASSRGCLRQADALIVSAGSSQVPPTASAVGGSGVARLPVFRFDAAWRISGLDAWLDRVQPARWPARATSGVEELS